MREFLIGALVSGVLILISTLWAVTDIKTEIIATGIMHHEGKEYTVTPRVVQCNQAPLTNEAKDNP